MRMYVNAGTTTSGEQPATTSTKNGENISKARATNTPLTRASAIALDTALVAFAEEGSSATAVTTDTGNELNKYPMKLNIMKFGASAARSTMPAN
jgi:hypothetical protein